MPSRNFSLRLSLFNAVLFLGSGIQLPFLPLWLKNRGLPDSQVALVVALMMAVRILGVPLGTFIADLTQRRRAVIIACAFGSTAAYVLLSFMASFWPILLAGMLAAALLAPIVPLTETLAVEGSAHYGLDYGRIRLWASLSFLTGSLGAGALLEVIPVGWVILLIAAAQALGALVTLLLPQDKAVRAASKVEPIRLSAFIALASAASFIVFMLAAGLGQASHGFLYAFGSVYFEALGYSKFVIGMLWAASVMAEVLMFAFSNRFYKAFGSVRLIMLGTVIATLRWAVTALAPPLALLFLVQTLHAGSFGLTHLGTMHYIRERVPANMRNTAQGLFSVLSSGILMSGTMWASGTLYAGLGGGAFFVMALISALACGLAVLLQAISPRGLAVAAA
ncbi:MFS transporter [Aestuariivirga sp.]|uniref:MFS transporter n=1 Tax=Aestuariivirga sp. TaxID=2650926 RepID=UPI00301959A8